MKATGLAGLFQAVVCWSDVPRGRGKPAPDILLLAAERLGVDLRRCLVFDDADEGVAARRMCPRRRRPRLGRRRGDRPGRHRWTVELAGELMPAARATAEPLHGFAYAPRPAR